MLFMKKYLALLLAIIFLVGSTAILIFRRTTKPPLSISASPSTTHVAYPSPNPFLINQAFATKPTFAIPTSTRVAIVPHHLLAARQMAALFTTLPQARTMIILSPDHFKQGKTSFTAPAHRLCELSGKEVDCAAGNLDEAKLSALANNISTLSRADAPFMNEHGIYTLLPFLRRTQPSVKIVPILVRHDTSKDDLEILSNQLVDLMNRDPSVLLLTSIDISHYQIQEVADFHDVFTRNAIERLDAEQALNTETDSPESLFVALSVAGHFNLEAEIQSHTNSMVLTRALLDKVSTSHFVATFGMRSSASSTERIETAFWHQLPKIETDEDRLYQGYDREKIFNDPSVPYFFGIVRKGEEISVYPFPYDKDRELLTRSERTKKIKEDENPLNHWLEKQLGTKNFNLIY